MMLMGEALKDIKGILLSKIILCSVFSHEYIE